MKTGKSQSLYIIFYLLFSPDTWRILIGLAATLIIGPRATATSDYSPAGQVLIWLMILVLGFVLSAPVGRFISRRLTVLFRHPATGLPKKSMAGKRRK